MQYSIASIRFRIFVMLATLIACVAMLAGQNAPATAATSSGVQSLLDRGVVTDDTRADTDFTDLYPDSPEGTIEVVTPGTDDTTLRPRIDDAVANRTTLLVSYPQSFWPVVAGQSGTFSLFSPTYDESKAAAIEGNLEVMEGLSNDPDVVFVRYSGYSQGADALGDALERAVAAGIIDKSKTVVVLWSDPRGPWGLKQGLAKFPLLPQVASVIGADINGARNPADTEDVPVEAIIVTADPVGNWQWNTWRPLSSLAVNAAGFLSCHSDPTCYGDLDKYDDPKVYKSVEGNTTYKVYTSLHPFTLLRMSIYDDLGLSYSETEVNRWEQRAQAFYAIEAPSVDNSAVPVYEVTDPVPPVNGVARESEASAEAPSEPVTPTLDVNSDADEVPASSASVVETAEVAVSDATEDVSEESPEASDESTADASSDADTDTSSDE